MTQEFWTEKTGLESNDWLALATSPSSTYGAHTQAYLPYKRCCWTQ